MTPAELTPVAEPSRREVERFTRTTLGCQCPDEVFRQVHAGGGAALAGVPVARRIAIGGRLLLVVVEGSAPGLARALPALAGAARALRERGGYHRVRVVVLSDRPREQGAELKAPFAAADGADDRVHLHVVARAEGETLCG